MNIFSSVFDAVRYFLVSMSAVESMGKANETKIILKYFLNFLISQGLIHIKLKIFLPEEYLYYN